MCPLGEALHPASIRQVTDERRLDSWSAGAAPEAATAIRSGNDADLLTVLRACAGHRLAKSYSIAANGCVVKRAYPNAKYFSVEAIRSDGIETLYRLLRDLEREPTACVIRGRPDPEADLCRARRMKRENGGIFEDVPRAWMMLDLDGLAIPAGVSVIEQPDSVARFVVEFLAGHAAELADVTAVVQFSASAGIEEMAKAEAVAGLAPRWEGAVKPGGGIGAHIWFWLTEPWDGAALGRWAQAINGRAGYKVIDLATLRTVQPHYTAGPGFETGLCDPLQGRRTILVRGTADKATLRIPERVSGQAGTSGTDAHADHGFTARLAMIGEPNGFHESINSAIASYIGANWPNPNVEVLLAALRERILLAEPGERSAAEIARYADPDLLRTRIVWVVERQAEQSANACVAHPAAPTFPDRGVTPDLARTQAGICLKHFAERLRKAETPELLLRMTVGAGKSEAVIRNVPTLLQAARDGGRNGALIYLVPRHDLGDELKQRIAGLHPGLTVATWRGMEAGDPQRPGKAMCLDLVLPRAARNAGLPQTEVCDACPLKRDCGYRRQRAQKAEVWLAAHNLAFAGKPDAMPEAALLVMDEAFWQTGLAGLDRLHPIEMSLSDLSDDRTGAVTGPDRSRLLRLRQRVETILRCHDEGGLLQRRFVDAGFTETDAAAWQQLEERTQSRIGWQADMDRNVILARLQAVRDSGFSSVRALLAKFVRELVTGEAARSVNAEVQPGGTTLRFAWRCEFAPWAAGAPKLLLDATTAPAVARHWLGQLEVAEIEVQAPGQSVRQIIGAEFGRSRFTQNQNNVRRLADLVIVELATAEDDILVISQKAVEDLLRAALLERCDAELRPGASEAMTVFGFPDGRRLHLAHHGAVTGLDEWRHVTGLIVVGRPALNRPAGERLATLVRGGPVEVVQDADAAHWPTTSAGIRLRSGCGRAVRQPCHPDPLVEALRSSITEGAVLQAIGRPRGVQRSGTNPVRVTLMAELALPVTVDSVESWDEAQPDRVMVAGAEAWLAKRALPLAPDDIASARKDLFRTGKAFSRYIEARGKNPQSLMKEIYKCLGGLCARYRKVGGRGSASFALVPARNGRAALEAVVGPLSYYEV